MDSPVSTHPRRPGRPVDPWHAGRQAPGETATRFPAVAVPHTTLDHAASAAMRFRLPARQRRVRRWDHRPGADNGPYVWPEWRDGGEARLAAAD